MNYRRVSPVPAGFYVSSPFGPRWGTQHRGVDFGKTGGSGGQPVYAAQSGKVVYAGAASGFGGRADGRAGWIVVDHSAADGAGTTVYGHVVRDTGITVGTRVVAGQRIGIINPDKTTNGGVDPHLHFEVHPYVWKAGSQIDPAVWLADARDPTIPTPSTTASSIRKPAASVIPASSTATLDTTETNTTKGTTVATADDVVKLLTQDDPAALLYRGREEDASGKGTPGFFEGNIKRVLAEIGFLVTTYEKAILPTDEPDVEDIGRQRHLLGWVLYLAGSALDIRKRLKRVEVKLDQVLAAGTPTDGVER